MKNGTNDNDSRARAEPDAHGQAAMLLTESLIHGLIERKVINTADAIQIVDIAADVKHEIAADQGESQETMQRALRLLNAISQSLAIDGAADGDGAAR